MSFYSNKLYLEDVNKVATNNLCWSKLQNKALLLSGATGLIGSFIIDVLMKKNTEGLNCIIYSLGRSKEKAKKRFSNWHENKKLVLISHDVNKPIPEDQIGKIDYVLHLASNTHPILYASDPIGTISTNIIGLKNMLDFASVHHSIRFAFASSVEVYGENRGDVDMFDENYSGYINSNTLRAGYPESKRCGEALCQAYRQQQGLDVVIARLARSYGPTMAMNDSRAISQFIMKGVKGEDIVLKSDGSQNFSYTYMADAAYGFLTILLCGKDGEAYNISDERSNITLKDLAQLTADYSGTKVVYDLPDAVEAAGYSKATKGLMNGNKLKGLGWKPFYTIKEGIPRTIDILKSIVP